MVLFVQKFATNSIPLQLKVFLNGLSLQMDNVGTVKEPSCNETMKKIFPSHSFLRYHNEEIWALCYYAFLTSDATMYVQRDQEKEKFIFIQWNRTMWKVFTVHACSMPQACRLSIKKRSVIQTLSPIIKYIRDLEKYGYPSRRAQYLGVLPSKHNQGFRCKGHFQLL